LPATKAGLATFELMRRRQETWWRSMSWSSFRRSAMPGNPENVGKGDRIRASLQRYEVALLAEKYRISFAACLSGDPKRRTDAQGHRTVHPSEGRNRSSAAQEVRYALSRYSMRAGHHA